SGGRDGHDGFDIGRDGDGERVGGASGAWAEWEERAAVGESELFGVAWGVDRERAVRAREGSVYGGDGAAGGAVWVGGWRDDFFGRGGGVGGETSGHGCGGVAGGGD